MTEGRRLRGTEKKEQQCKKSASAGDPEPSPTSLSWSDSALRPEVGFAAFRDFGLLMSKSGAQERKRRGRSKLAWAKESAGERDRRAATMPAGSPHSRRGRSSEPASCKVGRGPARAEGITMEQQLQVWVGIDVGKRQLAVALSTGERFTLDNDEAGIAEG